jgi:hypothetical protein
LMHLINQVISAITTYEDWCNTSKNKQKEHLQLLKSE